MVSLLEILPEYALSWMVQRGIERHVNERETLFKASPFNRTCTRVWFEDQGFDLFAECIKE